MTDDYGIPQPGLGGDSYVAFVSHDGRDYCLNVLLRLIQGPVPAIVSDPSIIDAVDELGSAEGIATPQDWWDVAVKKFPVETTKVVAHMRACETS